MIENILDAGKNVFDFFLIKKGHTSRNFQKLQQEISESAKLRGLRGYVGALVKIKFAWVQIKFAWVQIKIAWVKKDFKF